MTLPGKATLPLVKLPIVKGIVQTLNKDMGQHGLAKAFDKFLKNHAIKWSVTGLTKETLETLQKASVIVVANHEHEMEFVAVSACLPDRPDVFVIGVANLLNLGENFAKHLLPVFIRTSSVPEKEMKLTARIGRKFGLGAKAPNEKAHEFNLNSMRLAQDRLASGHLIMLFPQGVRKKSVWSPGIGHLVKSTAKNKHNTYLVRVHVAGTSDLDALRIVPIIKKVFPPIKVTVRKPQLTAAYLKDELICPKALTRMLQDEYNEWVKTLTENL